MRRFRGRLLTVPMLCAWCGLVAFGALPFVVLAAQGPHGTLTGATGIFSADQLQYLAWVRDLGSHVLASNRFDLAPSAHVFWNPVFGVSGALVWVGVSPGLAYLLWLPVAAAALLAGFGAYVGRLLDEPRSRLAAIALALFAASPIGPLLDLRGGLSTDDHNQLARAIADLTPALQLWGYFPIAIALALVCVALLAFERAMRTDREAASRSVRAELAIAAGAACLAGWLHPWQGATVLLIVVAVTLLQRSRAMVLGCVVVAAGALVPLVYYWALSHFDHDWAFASNQNNDVAFAWWVAPVALGLLALGALPAIRRPSRDVQERILLIWPMAALALYLLGPPYAIHTLESASLPLAILAVRGATRSGAPAAVAIVLLVVATVPGLVFSTGLLRKAVREHRTGYVVAGGEARAMAAVEQTSGDGGVLTGGDLASVVPAFTGHPTWFGHPSWTPELRLREAKSADLFSGAMDARDTRRFIASTGARFVIAPCGSSRSLPALLGAHAIVSIRRTGCATVIVLRKGTTPPNG